jgi:autoinducer 2 (AI-2) kinase
MEHGLLMGLDLGGGGARCLLLDTGSGRVTTALRPWASQPAPGVPLGMQYDPVGTWAALVAATRDALVRAGGRGERVLGIAATSMRHGSALLDGAGRELLLAPNRDARGTPTALRLGAERGLEIHRRTGHWPNAVQAAGRLRWLATEAPEVLARATTALALSDWIAWKLCGERATEASQASETGLLSIERPAWDFELIDALELPRRIFPELRASGSRLAGLAPEAAQALGLPPGIPVAVGGADTQCGLLGSGVLAPGELGMVAGTSAPVLQLCARPTLDPDGKLWAVHHLVAGRFALESNGGALGESLDWIAGLLFPDLPHPVLNLLAEAEAAPRGSAGLLSTFGVDVMDARAMMLPVGNVTLNHMTTAGDPKRRRHFARSILEGMAFALRANAEQIEAVTGVTAGAVRVAGGVSRSTFFTELLAEVMGRPVEVAAVSEATALGAALCAGAGAGLFRDLEAGARARVAVARRHEPDPGAADTYARLYAGWREVRTARRASDARAAGLAIGALALGGAAAQAPADGFRPRILVTADVDADSLAALREIGEVEHKSYREAMRLLTGPSLAAALAGVNVLITEVDVLDARGLLASPDLRVVGVCRGDAVNVDLEACTALGIPVFHTPGRNADAVADLTLAFLLALARRLPAANAFLRQPGGEAGDMGRMGRAFAGLRGRELWGKTVGLVGLGAVGRKVVERLGPFGARILVHDPFLAPDAVRVAGGEPAELPDLLAASDFVSLHAAVTDASRGLIDREALARMKRGACLVNTARAALVDAEALLDALRAGHLGGAALDVFPVEPPASDDPLLALDTVIATPHIGGNTEEVAAHQGRIVVEELLRIRRGERPRHLLNPAAFAAFDWSRPRPPPPPELAARVGAGPGPAVTDLDRRAREPRARPPAPTAPTADPGGSAMQDTKSRMQALLQRFADSARGDDALGAFARDAGEVMLHFAVVDLGLDLHLGFSGGRVAAGLGPPAAPGAVQLKLRADLFDGMLTGRRNAMQAAMNGELSFSGDTAKAMTLQQINADLSRLYRAVRAEVGDPGDLAALPDPRAAAAPAAPAAREPAGPASAIPAGDVRHEMCRIVHELYAAQLITATGGNVSARNPDAPDQAWITPSQLFKGDLRPEILVRIGMDGKALDPDSRSPSSEALMHTAVLQARPEAQAVIHCHAPNATILVNAGLPFLPISTEAAFFRDIGRIPFVMPGTQALADAIVAAMGQGWAVLMQNHGLIVAGRSLRRAADMAEIIERTAQVIIGCRSVGVDPPVLPDKVVAMLAKYGDLMA